jgi:class 3 adenylate cyclase/tetratricopeptide (TPR) repeat protein
VKCRDCGHDNIEGARFCSHCGHGLSYPCPICGTIAGPDDRFCRNCGTELGSAARHRDVETPTESSADDLSRYLPEELLAKMRSAREGHAMEGERRTVTMMFADVQGSTSAAEKLDPEDWAEIMNGAFERLIAPIYRYEGTLAQLRGDAILAFFGAPIAHEDDPVRALRAGLEIVEAMAGYSNQVEGHWGVPAHVRVGINTGLVVVGPMGSDLRVEYTALGDAINVAARMEQTAAPDTVRVTGHTLSLTNGMFDAEELGPIEVKGKAEPVPAYRVVRYAGWGSIADSAPLVGRAAELTRLEDMRDQVLGGAGRIASVIAEAGVGKTRLIDELTRMTLETSEAARRFDDPGGMNWLRGMTRSYDSGRHYSTIADMLARWWFREGSSSDFRRIEMAVAAEDVGDVDMAAYLAFVAGVSLPDRADSFIRSLETQVLNGKAAQAVISYIKAIAERRPTFVALEDVHWADDLSLALVENLMTLTESVPLGLLVAMRPFRDEPSWRIPEMAERDHHHRYIAIDLEPLDPDDSSALLETLLQDSIVDSRAKQGILDRSEGNPLYIEQMVRALEDVPEDELDVGQVPSSLRGLLTARLDRLGEEQRYVVQMASVLGSEFDRAMLAILVDSPDIDAVVTELLRGGILVEVADRQGSLAFHHALIQETSYETILRRTRRELHRRVADQLIANDGESREIARHLLAAEQAEAAYPYLVAAGVDATRSMALADAIELLNTAIENTPDDAEPELIVLAHDSLGQAYALIPDLSKAAASYQRLYDFGENTQRPEAQVAALNRLGYATASIGADLERAGEYLAEARRIAEENNDELGLAEYHMNACFVASMGGDPGTALAHDEETVRIGEEKGVDRLRLVGMLRRATNYIALLDWERGLPAVETALREAEELGLEEGGATVRLAGSAMAKAARGDLRGALEEAERILGTLERYGSFYVAMCHRLIAQCHYELGNLEEALGHYLDVTRTATAMGQPFTAASGASGMALVYATVGLADQTPALKSEAEDHLGGPIGEFLASTVLADLGWASLMIEVPEKAAEEFTRGLAASSTTQFIERPRLLVGRARAHLALDDLEGAETDLAAASSFAAEKGLDSNLAEIGLAEGLIAIREGAIERANRALSVAHEEAMSRGQRLAVVSILSGRARLASLMGDDQQAATHAEAARTAAGAIASGIADESLRSVFTSRWHAALTAL